MNIGSFVKGDHVIDRGKVSLDNGLQKIIFKGSSILFMRVYTKSWDSEEDEYGQIKFLNDGWITVDEYLFSEIENCY